jgi:ATP/ADP translocase/HEAT repeat protein
MAENGIRGIFARIIKVKPGELKISFLFFSYLFLVIAAYNVIKPIRNASLLDELGYRWLPLVYLLTAFFIGFVVALHSRIQVKMSRLALITSSILFFFISCFIFRAFSNNGWQGLPVIFWVWANVFIIVLNTQFWITVNDVFNPREFKRLSGFFISGGILGGFIGGGFAGLLAKTNVDYNLLFLSAGLLALCVFFVYLIFQWQKKEQSVQEDRERKEEEKVEIPFKPGFRDNFNTVKRNKYLSLIAVIVVLTLIVSTLIDFQFQTIVQNRKEGNLTSFFGYFNAGLMVFAFLLSILMTSNLFKRYGVRLSLMLYPVVLLLCISGIGVFVSLVMAIVIKGSDKSLSYTINRAARELLFIPVSPTLKYKAIVFIDMFVDRFAKGLGAILLMVILLFGIQDYTEIVRIVSLVSVVLIVCWIVLTLWASREYVNSIKDKIPPPEDRPDHRIEKELDLDYTKRVFDALASRNRSPNLYAMHVFELMKRGQLTSELRELLSERTEEVIPASLNPYFKTDPSALIKLDDLTDDDEMKKEIQEITSLEVYEEVINRYIENVLSSSGKDTETTRMEIAKGIGFLPPNSSIVEKLETFLADESSEVRKLAIESAAQLGKREHVHALIQNLNYPSTNKDASSALEKYGESITGILADYLNDTEKNVELRKSVVSVMAHIGNQEAVDFILLELSRDLGEMDRELIDALDRIRSKNPEVVFSEKAIKKKTWQKVNAYYDKFIAYAEIESMDDEAKNRGMISQELRLLMLDIFRLLGLIYSHEDIVQAYQNIRTGTKNSVAYAVELLDNKLDKEIKRALLPLVEDLSREDRMKACVTLRKDLPEF